MSFCSSTTSCADATPGRILSDATRGLNERVCVQVKRVYDSCLSQQQLTNVNVTVNSLMAIPPNPCSPCYDPNKPLPVITPPVIFQCCRNASSTPTIRDLTVDRLCDRPQYARVRAAIDIPLDILFTDCYGVQGIGRGTVTVTRDVLLAIPDESIIPFCIEATVSAICVNGTYVGNNVFQLTICLTLILKVIAEVEILIPSYGFCSIPPCQNFAENLCDEFFSLPIYPPEGTGSGPCVPCNPGSGCGCGRGERGKCHS